MTETIKDNSKQHTRNWVEDIRKGAEIERKEREETSRQRSKEAFNKMRDKANAERAANQELFYKAISKTRKEEEKKRALELEKAKARALDKVEEEYEKHGVKSSKTEKLENAYRSTLKNLRGLDD